MAQFVTNIVQGVGGGIGFVSEAYKAHKATKAQKQADITALHRGTISSNDTATVHNFDQEAYDFDEPQADPDGQGTLEQDQATDPSALASAFITRLPAASPSAPPFPPHEPVPYPIIIPQLRPKDRTRGFIQAYAPILASRSISEATFLDFISTFNNSTQATIWIAALNLASLATIALPTVTSILVSMAITAATTAAMEVQGRVKTNRFLDKVNAEFFMPKGLFCLIVTWNPSSVRATHTVDFENMARKAMESNGKNPMHKLKKSNAETHGEFEWPEIAPLVYPDLASPAKEEKQEKQSSLQQKRRFVEDYMDRRAQAKFVSPPTPDLG